MVRGTGWTHRDIRAGASRSWPIGSVVDDCVPPAIPHNMVSNGHCYLRLRNDSRDTMIGAVRQVRVWPHRPASASSAHCRHGGDPSLACQTEHHGRSTTAMMRFIPCLHYRGDKPKPGRALAHVRGRDQRRAGQGGAGKCGEKPDKDQPRDLRLQSRILSVDLLEVVQLLRLVRHGCLEAGRRGW